MIEGLKIDVPSAELKEHLAERADYHRGKRRFYEQQAASLDRRLLERAGLSPRIAFRGNRNTL